MDLGRGWDLSWETNYLLVQLQDLYEVAENHRPPYPLVVLASEIVDEDYEPIAYEDVTAEQLAPLRKALDFFAASGWLSIEDSPDPAQMTCAFTASGMSFVADVRRRRDDEVTRSHDARAAVLRLALRENQPAP